MVTAARNTSALAMPRQFRGNARKIKENQGSRDVAYPAEDRLLCLRCRGWTDQRYVAE
jgi:hypothetical protein